MLLGEGRVALKLTTALKDVSDLLVSMQVLFKEGLDFLLVAWQFIWRDGDDILQCRQRECYTILSTWRSAADMQRSLLRSTSYISKGCTKLA